jgi:hypothetical protein
VALFIRGNHMTYAPGVSYQDLKGLPDEVKNRIIKRIRADGDTISELTQKLNEAYAVIELMTSLNNLSTEVDKLKREVEGV